MADFGALSLVPPLFAILLAILTRKAVLSLFLGLDGRSYHDRRARRRADLHLDRSGDR